MIDRGIRGRVRRWLLAALVVAGGTAWTYFDWYEVRGNSMQPLLVDALDARDRILARRPFYASGSPERFDLVIFDRPPCDAPAEQVADVSGDRCIKRVAFLAGERPIIDDGDLFVEEGPADHVVRTRLRRTNDQIRRMLVEVEPFQLSAGDAGHWVVAGDGRVNGSTWIAAAAGVESGAATELQYQDPVLDTWIDSAGRTQTGGHVVNDVGIEFTAEHVEPGTILKVELREQGDVFVIQLSRGKEARIERKRGTARGAIVPATDLGSGLPDRPVRVLAINCDDRILVWFDEQLVLEAAYDGNEQIVGLARNTPSLLVVEGKLELSRIRIVRDAFYTPERVAGAGNASLEVVPAGCVFVLGDNSPNSIDSRDFGPIRVESIRGVPLFRRRPGVGWRGL